MPFKSKYVNVEDLITGGSHNMNPYDFKDYNDIDPLTSNENFQKHPNKLGYKYNGNDLYKKFNVKYYGFDVSGNLDISKYDYFSFILVGGGGGGGGGAYPDIGTYSIGGGGGGGGASGQNKVYTNINKVTDKNTLSVTIGSGGAGGNIYSDSGANGESGNKGIDTTLSYNDIEYKAIGGGGGGGGTGKYDQVDALAGVLSGNNDYYYTTGELDSDNNVIYYPSPAMIGKECDDNSEGTFGAGGNGGKGYKNDFFISITKGSGGNGGNGGSFKYDSNDNLILHNSPIKGTDGGSGYAVVVCYKNAVT